MPVKPPSRPKLMHSEHRPVDWLRAEVEAAQPPDVFVHRRALLLSESAIDTPQAKKAQAITFLEVVRHGLRSQQPIETVADAPKEIDVGVAAEPSRPVGNGTYGPEFRWASYREALRANAPVPDPELFKFNDATVRTWAMSVLRPHITSNELGDVKQPLTRDGATFLRNMVRAKEIGLDVHIFHYSRSGGKLEFWNRTWPVDDATAALLRRAAKAFGFSESDVRFGDETLADYKPPPPPVKRVAVKRRPPAMLGMDLIATLESYYPTLRLARRLSGDPAMHQVVGLFIELLSLPDDVRQFVRDFLMGQAVEGGIEEPDDVPLPAFREERHREFEVPTGPLATEVAPNVDKQRALTNTMLIHLWATDEAVGAMTQAPDLSINGFNPYIKDMPLLVEKANLLARRIELNPEATELIEFTRKAFANSAGLLPIDDATSLSLIRLAQAANLPLDQSYILKYVLPHKHRVSMTLAELAEQLGLRVRPPAPDDVATVLTPFGAPVAAVEERIAAMGRLRHARSNAPDFSAVIAGAGALLGEGRLAPLDWGELNAPQKQRVLQLLTFDRHRGAANVLAALFVRGGGDAFDQALDKALDAVGVEGNWEWNGFRHRFEALAPEDQKFVLGDLMRDGTVFQTFGLRLDLTGEGALAPSVALARWGTLGVSEVVDVLRERALALGRPDIDAALEVFRDQPLRAAIEAARKLDKEGAAFQAALRLARELLDASPENQEEAMAALGRWRRENDDSNGVLGNVLALLHEEERGRVLSLEATDIEMGGVAPRPFKDARSIEERLAVGPVGDFSKMELSSFAAIDGVKPYFLNEASVKHAYPEVAQALRMLQLQLMLKAAQSLQNDDVKFVSAEDADAQALVTVNRILGPALRKASAEDKPLVYSAGRTLLSGFRDAYETLLDHYE